MLAAAEAAGICRAHALRLQLHRARPHRAAGRLLDESAEPRDRAWINDYERTKTLSDRAARKAIAAGAPLSVVYPGVIYGPGEMTEGNIVVRHILDLVHGRLPGADRQAPSGAGTTSTWTTSPAASPWRPGSAHAGRALHARRRERHAGRASTAWSGG